MPVDPRAEIEFRLPGIDVVGAHDAIHAADKADAAHIANNWEFPQAFEPRLELGGKRPDVLQQAVALDNLDILQRRRRRNRVTGIGVAVGK